MVIVLTGGTGFIGPALIKKLIENNHMVHILTRSFSSNSNQCRFFSWPDVHSPLPLEAFPTDSDFGIIHLAGESISNWPWTSARKKRIYESRVLGTQNLVNTIKNLNRKPRFFISASATGIYGEQGDQNVNEDWEFKNQNLFLQNVCKNWEAESFKLKNISRIILFRLGVVLSFEGGFLKEQIKRSQFLQPFFLYKNKLWISWIHRKDLVQLILWSIKQESLQGIYNATTSEPFDLNSFFNYLKKPLLKIPVPLFLVKWLGGEMTKNLLVSCRVMPEKIKKEGFQFKYKTLEDVFKK